MTPPSATAPADARCLTCGYSLAGLPRSGACPECARPIFSSAIDRPLTILGDTQAQRLATGLWLITSSLLWSWIGVGILFFALAFFPIAFLAIPCGLTAVILWCVGWCRVAGVRTLLVPDVAPVARAITLCAAWGQCAGAALGLAPCIGLHPMVPGVLAPISCAGVMMAGTHWLGAIAAAGGNPAGIVESARRTRRIQWVAAGVTAATLVLIVLVPPAWGGVGVIGVMMGALLWFAAIISFWTFLSEMKGCVERRLWWTGARPA